MPTRQLIRIFVNVLCLMFTSKRSVDWEQVSLVDGFSLERLRPLLLLVSEIVEFQ